MHQMILVNAECLGLCITEGQDLQPHWQTGSFYGLGGQECHVVRAAPDGDMYVQLGCLGVAAIPDRMRSAVFAYRSLYQWQLGCCAFTAASQLPVLTPPVAAGGPKWLTAEILQRLPASCFPKPAHLKCGAFAMYCACTYLFIYLDRVPACTFVLCR